MIIDTTLLLQTFDGESYKENDIDLTFGIAMAKMLSRNQDSKDPLKDTVLSIDFYKMKELDISKEDIAYCSEVVKASNLYITGARGRILLIFKHALEKEKSV